MTSLRVRLVPCLLVLFVGGVLAGCSGSVSTGDPTVSNKELEKQASRLLEQATDTKVDVTCDGGLKAKKGTKKYCTGVAEGQDDLEQTVRIKVRSVKDDKANLRVVILKQIDPANAEDSVQQQLADAGEPDAKVDCPDDNIDLEADTTFDCDITGSKQGDTATFTITKDNDENAVDVDIT
ncbi:MAG: hypothetical protein JWM98_315 [Thermoleophilia bacterium]|nr:hypothetical protein [Thermoleophilia bacterium]